MDFNSERRLLYGSLLIGVVEIGTVWKDKIDEGAGSNVLFSLFI